MPRSLPRRGAQSAKWPFFRIKVDLSCETSMLLVFWHRQRSTFGAEYCLIHAITHHPPKTDSPCSVVSLRQPTYLFVLAAVHVFPFLPFSWFVCRFLCHIISVCDCYLQCYAPPSHLQSTPTDNIPDAVKVSLFCRILVNWQFIIDCLWGVLKERIRYHGVVCCDEGELPTCMFIFHVWLVEGCVARMVFDVLK